MVETKYGIISDVHRKPAVVGVAPGVLKNLGAQKLILNGDLGDDAITQVTLIGQALDTGLEVYVQPGSHEKREDFNSLLSTFSNHNNLINVQEERKIEHPDHHLVFMPGSDWCAGNGDCYFGRIPEEKVDEHPNTFNLNDLYKHVSHPDKTIVLCHVPRRFDSLEHGVDVAYFAESFVDGKKNIMPGVVFESMVNQQTDRDFSKDEYVEIAKANGFDLKTENVGSTDLRDIYEELGVKMAVSGHIHEAGKRAHDRSCNPVKERTYVNELFWNPGPVDDLNAGILTVKDGMVSYQNVYLPDVVQ